MTLFSDWDFTWEVTGHDQKICIYVSPYLISKTQNIFRRCKSITRSTTKLQTSKQDHGNISSKHSSDIGLTNLQEIKIEIGPYLLPVATKPYTLPLKHHTFVKEETENLLEAWLIKCTMSTFAMPVIMVSRKSKAGAPLAETKWLVMDYIELKKMS